MFIPSLAALTLALAALRGRLHAVTALLLATAAFAVAQSMSVSQFGKVFGTGFGQTFTSLGLPILAASFIATIAAEKGGTAWLAARTSAWPAGARAAILAAVGLAAGTASTHAAGFAVTSPVRAALQGQNPRRAALVAALAASAGQGFLVPSPMMIAAAAILGAQPMRVLMFGAPIALVATAFGTALVWRVQSAAPPASGPAPRALSSAAGLAAACTVMLALLIIQSLGAIPTEPFGGGSSRELILGLGRPAMLLFAAAGIALISALPWPAGALSQSGWAARAIERAAPLALLVATAGGLQSLAQTNHVPELFAERILPYGLGLAIPFLAALMMKALQGSSLVAAITAAGMVQPLLPALGLAGDTGRALATLAIGAGALSASLITDPFFWLASTEAGLQPHQAIARLTVPTLLQGLLALMLLVAINALQ